MSWRRGDGPWSGSRPLPVRIPADALKLLNEAAPNDQVVKLKALEAFAAAADGKATKIIIPSELQGLAGLAAGAQALLGKDK